jgi:FKBP-type peptidyl-prolyl cis-trans isomerase FklB
VGETFLEANRKRPGVTTLPSGLQYEVIAEGNGKKPTLDQTVTINYRGTLVDGTEFDSSYKRGEPATFPINQLIEGWKQALQLMPVGSHWRVYVPSSLAYGERGQGNLIGPNATLIFEIELLAIR